MPVAQPLIAPRFAAGPAIAAETASDVAPAVESEAGGSEPPSAPRPRGPSAFSPGPAARPPLATTATLQQAAPASSEPPGPVERPVAEGTEQPSLLPPALKPEAAAPERPAPTAQRAAHGHAEREPVLARQDRLVQSEANPPVPGRAGSIILQPAQPDGPPAQEPQPGAPLKPIAREPQLGSGPELERPRQVPEETIESRGTAHGLVPEPPASGGPEKATALLDVRPNVTVGLAPARPMSERRAATAPDALLQPPTIRVTIGRVEVQAVMPPAPTPVYAPPARREPTLSLKDYLKQRDEAQR